MPTALPPPDAPPADALARLAERLDLAHRLGERRTADSVAVPIQLLARELLRNKLIPALDPRWPAHDPPHVVLAGATNTGKSTLLNTLIGASACEVSPTARFTQHPQALFAAGEQPHVRPVWASFPTRLTGVAFAGENPPRPVSDEQLARGEFRPSWAARPWPDNARPASPAAIYWDLPDFSTLAAQHYLVSVYGGLALADVVVFVVTDESYADDRALKLLGALSAVSAATVVTVNKMPADDEELAADVTRVLGAAVGHGAAGHGAAIFLLPRVPGSSQGRVDRLLATPAGQAWRTAVAERARPSAKLDSARAAARWIDDQLDSLLVPLAREAALADEWREQLADACQLVTVRYNREYISSRQNPEFKKALVELTELLDVPGLGPVLKATRNLVGKPLQWAGSALHRWLTPAMGGPPSARNRLARWLGLSSGDGAAAAADPHAVLLADLLETWQARLLDWAQARGQAQPDSPWPALAAVLAQPERKTALAERFDQAMTTYHQRLAEQVRQRAGALHAVLLKHPKVRYVAQGINATFQAGSVALAIKAGGVNVHDLLLVPLASGVTGLLVQAGLGEALEQQEHLLRQWQRQAFERLWVEAVEPWAAEALCLRASAADLAAARADWSAGRDALLAKLDSGGTA